MGVIRLMTIPLVTVITTVCSCEKYIEESLNSIFNQTFRDFEIIIYDDASTDKTWQVIIEFIKENSNKFMGRIKMVPGKKNVGCGEGRNRAIRVSKSKYLVIQDGDDISFQIRLEKEVEFLESHDDIFCVGAWADKMEENGDFIELMTYPPITYEEVYNSIMIENTNPIIDPSCMFRRDIFNKLGGYDSKWKLVPDFNLWTRAVKEGYRLSNLPEILVHYRKQPNSVTTKYEMAVVREHSKMCKIFFK